MHNRLVAAWPQACYHGPNQASVMDNVPESLKHVLKQAKELLEEGSPQEAREVLLDNPDASDIPLYHLMMARIAKDSGQLEAGISHIEKVLELDPGNESAIMIVLEYKSKNNLVADALHLIEQAYNIDGLGTDQRIRISKILSRLGKTKEAVEYIEKLQAENPNEKKLRLAYASALKENSELDKYAVEALDSIELLDLKDSVGPRLELAEYFLAQRNYGEAIGVLSPLNSLAQSEIADGGIYNAIKISLSLCHLRLKNTNRARELMSQVTRNDSIRANYVWSLLQLLEGDLQNAIRSLHAYKTCCQHQHDKLLVKLEKLSSASPPNQLTADSAKRKIQNLLVSLQAAIEYQLLDTIDSAQSFLDVTEPVFSLSGKIGLGR